MKTEALGSLATDPDEPDGLAASMEDRGSIMTFGRESRGSDFTFGAATGCQTSNESALTFEGPPGSQSAATPGTGVVNPKLFPSLFTTFGPQIPTRFRYRVANPKVKATDSYLQMQITKRTWRRREDA